MPTKNWDGQNANHNKKSGQNANLWLAFRPVGILSGWHFVLPPFAHHRPLSKQSFRSFSRHPVKYIFKRKFIYDRYVKVPNVRAVSEGSRSTLSYTPQTSMDYGTLLCLGKLCVVVCILLYLVVFRCVWLFFVVFGCISLCLVVFCCVGLYLVVHSSNKHGLRHPSLFR